MSRRPKLDPEREAEFRRAYWDMQRLTPKKMRERFGLPASTYNNYVARARAAGRDVMPKPQETDDDV